MLMSTRCAGQHARETVERRRRRVLFTLAVLVSTAIVVAVITRLAPVPVLAISGALIGATKFLERFELPVIERWSRGATGEEHVGNVLEELVSEGWSTLYDVSTGRGNIDAVVVGSSGVFTVEVKSHGGRIPVDRISPEMLSQAYARKKWLEAITGRDVTPLLVFSRAYLVGRPVSRQRGVTVLPARMLADHLRRYEAELRVDEARALYARLAAALEPLGAAA